LPADLCVHFDVVIHFRFFVLVGMQQMFFAFEVLIDFAVHFNVLEATVEYNKDLGVDGPVIEVADVALENEFEGAEGADLIFVFSIQAFQ